jgi:hypothetical protein
MLIGGSLPGISCPVRVLGGVPAATGVLPVVGLLVQVCGFNELALSLGRPGPTSIPEEVLEHHV